MLAALAREARERGGTSKTENHTTLFLKKPRGHSQNTSLAVLIGVKPSKSNRTIEFSEAERNTE